MAANLGERTEAPTPRRRQEARTKGQVARSPDLTAAVILLAAFLALRWITPVLWNCLERIVASALFLEGPVDTDEVRSFTVAVLLETAKTIGPLVLILLLATLVALYAQVGGLFTWHPLKPSLNKINPLAGLQRMFSTRSFVSASVSLGKLLVVGAVAVLTLQGGGAAVLYAFDLGVHEIVVLSATLVFDLGIRLSVALLILALADYAWQRYRHERELRMTKEEVKDELRTMEGDPQIKRRRRQIQMQMALQRLRKDVPKADVVVTNPTHLAIAIQYDAETMIAPKVVAKGADYLALRIRRIAQEHGIPIVERRPLARALYESVEVGRYIPERFYHAIAEILAYIYEITGRAPRGMRKELSIA